VSGNQLLQSNSHRQFLWKSRFFLCFCELAVRFRWIWTSSPIFHWRFSIFPARESKSQKSKFIYSKGWDILGRCSFLIGLRKLYSISFGAKHSHIRRYLQSWGRIIGCRLYQVWSTLQYIQPKSLFNHGAPGWCWRFAIGSCDNWIYVGDIFLTKNFHIADNAWNLSD